MSNSDQLSLEFQYKKYEDDMSKWEKFLSLPNYQIDESERGESAPGERERGK